MSAHESFIKSANRIRALRPIIAGSVGNVMEWYDFTVYGYFAATIGRQFFPSKDPFSSLLASFGAFAVGFLVRPLGALIFGYVGDKLGRRAALWTSVLAMALPTFAIGLLPTFGQIGLLAPLLLVAVRLFQGLAVAGEAATSVTFLIEQARPKRRALAGSLGTATAVLGMLIGSGVGAIVTSLLNETELQDWGWRIPFLAGIAISAVAIYLRRSLPSEEVKQRATKAPLREAFATRWRTMLVLLGLNAVGPVGFYLCLIFTATYLHRTDHLATSTVLDINTIAAVMQLLATPLAAAVSDRIGRRPVLFFGAGGLLFLAWPLIWVMHHPNPAFALSGQIVLTILVAVFTGTAPTMMAELLPHRIRCTAFSFSFNVGFGVIGGLTPLAALYLMRLDSNALSPAYLLMAAAAVSILVLAFLPETSRRLLGADDSAVPQRNEFEYAGQQAR